MRVISLKQHIFVLSMVVITQGYADVCVDDKALFDDELLRTTYVGNLSPSSVASVNGNNGLSNIFLFGSWFNNQQSYYYFKGLSWTADSNYVVVPRFFEYPGLSGTLLGIIGIYDPLTLNLVTSMTLDPLFTTNAYRIQPYLKTFTFTPTFTTATYIVCPRISTPTVINIFRFNGATLQKLTSAQITIATNEQTATVSWSPSGRYIAVCIADGINIYSFDGVYTYLVTTLSYPTGNPNNSVSWSYDGTKVGFVDKNGNHRIYSFDGLALTPFIISTTQTGTAPKSVLRFHPTETVFAVVRYPSSAQTVDLYAYDNLGNAVLLQSFTTSESSSGDLDWFPDGTYFAVGNANAKIYSFDKTLITPASQVGSPIALTISDTIMSWSPNGKYIVFSELAEGATSPTLQIFSTGFNAAPSYAEALNQAPANLSTIVTSTADQFWGITAAGDLLFSSTEASIARMRGRWVSATSQGSLTNGCASMLIQNPNDGYMYALDVMGGVHKSGSVIVGPSVRINWTVLSNSGANSPVLIRIYPGQQMLLGTDQNGNIYKYRSTSGWVLIN